MASISSRRYSVNVLGIDWNVHTRSNLLYVAKLRRNSDLYPFVLPNSLRFLRKLNGPLSGGFQVGLEVDQQ
jgi:hypothetical protein